MARLSYLYFSEEDIRAAQVMFDNKLWSQCGRLCEQSVEKRFKYYLERKGEDSDRFLMTSHKVHILYDRVCTLAGKSVDLVWRNGLANLSDYYFDTNYPQNNNIVLDEIQATESLTLAKQINSFIDSSLPQGMSVF